MIVIKDKNFELTQVKDTEFFNLSVLSIINAGKDNERQEMKIVAYGLPFEAAFKKIVALKISQEHSGVICSTAEYIELYKNAVEEIGKLVTYEENTKLKESDDQGEDN